MKKTSKTKKVSVSKAVKKGFFDRNPLVKNILWALAVAVGGLILFNVFFILNSLFQTLIDKIVGLFAPAEFADMSQGWQFLISMRQTIFLILVFFASWLIFRTRLGDLYKAIYATVPLAFTFGVIGASFYRWPLAVYGLSAIFGLGVLYYLKKTKQPWIYYFSLIYTSILMLIVVIAGIDI